MPAGQHLRVTDAGRQRQGHRRERHRGDPVEYGGDGHTDHAITSRDACPRFVAHCSIPERHRCPEGIKPCFKGSGHASIPKITLPESTGEILYTWRSATRAAQTPAKVGNAWPSKKDLRQSSGAIGRGSVIGFVLGILPGGGAVLSSLAAYALEKRRAKDPSRFGKGAVEGVAAPETANNAAATSSFIPLLTLGIPANATMAVIFGALLIQGVSPGPQLVSQEPELFWGVINSMYIGNILLLIMSIPLVGLFVRILKVRASVLAPITVLITLVGVYTVNNDVFDIVLVIVFGAVGYLMKKLGFDPGPLVLAFVLGSLLEDSLRRSLLIFDGDPTGFFTRPISGTLLVAFVLVAALPFVRRASRRRKEPVESA
ncbi:MAG: tripartite tricarboxylate transporter permease [Actinophytocola sp.]|uniref:tripartite tricarboxylate transporter permease n=1 Tax=Actinophytocola sp. TaxID=1872138 RepID=UPI003C780E2E